MKGPILGTAHVRGVGLCHVRQLKPGSPSMELTPVDYHPTYSNSPLIRHRSLVEWRTVNPNVKEAA